MITIDTAMICSRQPTLRQSLSIHHTPELNNFPSLTDSSRRTPFEASEAVGAEVFSFRLNSESSNTPTPCQTYFGRSSRSKAEV